MMRTIYWQVIWGQWTVQISKWETVDFYRNRQNTFTFFLFKNSTTKPHIELPPNFICELHPYKQLDHNHNTHLIATEWVHIVIKSQQKHEPTSYRTNYSPWSTYTGTQLPVITFLLSPLNLVSPQAIIPTKKHVVVVVDPHTSSNAPFHCNQRPVGCVRGGGKLATIITMVIQSSGQVHYNETVCPTTVAVDNQGTNKIIVPLLGGNNIIRNELFNYQSGCLSRRWT